MRKRIKVGMVGGGRGAFFAGYHRAAMRLCTGSTPWRVPFRPIPFAAAARGDAFDLAPERIHASFSSMAENEAARDDRIDVAVIVTPNHLQYEPSRRFLEQGIR